MAVIAHLTDFHLRPPGIFALGRIDTDTFVMRAIDAVIAKHPDLDAVVVSGDIADLGEDDAYARASMLLSRFAVPVFVVPGNHDRTGALRDAFIAWPGIAAAPLPDKVCYKAMVGDVAIVMLDTSVDGLDTGHHHGTLGAAQLAWLDDALSGGGPTLIAMHHPPFPVGIGFMDTITLTDADAFCAVVSRHQGVKRVVCGHVHRTIVCEVAGVPAIAIPGVAHQVALVLDEEAPPSLVMEPPAYGIHIVGTDQAVSHVAYVDDFGGAARFGALSAAADPAR